MCHEAHVSKLCLSLANHHRWVWSLKLRRESLYSETAKSHLPPFSGTPLVLRSNSPWVIAILALAGASCFSILAAEPPGIIGRWVALEPDLRTKRALIVITRDGNQVVGTISQLFDQAEDDPDPVCQRCEGVNRNRKIIGLPILFLSLEDREGQYRGTILDPEDGRTYRCVATPDITGNELTIKGYIGMPIFGRTETWVRLP